MSRYFNLRAFSYHLLASLIVVGLFALIILTVWYPSIWSKALGGYDLFIKIVIIDLIAGPLCLGLVYKAHKPLKEKLIEIITIGSIQLAFLGYGLWVLSESRPAFIVFAVDRFDVYVANEIDQDYLGDHPPFNKISITGPVYAGIDPKRVPKDLGSDLVIAGLDISMLAKYYEPIDHFADEIRDTRREYNDLPESPFKSALTRYGVKHKLTLEELSWLPVRHRSISDGFGFLSAIFVGDSIKPHGYLDYDGYEGLVAIEAAAPSTPIELNTGSANEMSETIEEIIEQEEAPSLERVETHREEEIPLDPATTEMLSETIEAIIEEDEE